MSIKLLAQVWEHETTGTERAVIQVLCDSANDDGICWPSNDKIAWKVGVLKRQVQLIMKDLRGRGIVEIVEQGGKGPRDTNKVMVNLDAIPRKSPYNPEDEDIDDDPGLNNATLVVSQNKGVKGVIRGTKGVIQMTPEPSVEPSEDTALYSLSTSNPHGNRLPLESHQNTPETPTQDEQRKTLERNGTFQNQDVSGDLLGKTNSEPSSKTTLALEENPAKLYTSNDYLQEYFRITGTERISDKKAAMKYIRIIIESGVNLEDMQSLYNHIDNWTHNGADLSLMAQAKQIDRWRVDIARQKNGPPTRDKSRIHPEDLPMGSAARMKLEKRIAL